MYRIKDHCTWKTLIIVLIAVLGITLNHASIQLGRYVAESTQQQESIDRGRLMVFETFNAVAGVDFDGSVVPPSGFGNDLRTTLIDVIVGVQSLALIGYIGRKKQSA